MEKDNLLYLIELNNNIIGAYDNLNDAEIYIYGCFQNNFFEYAKIKIFKNNSCYSIETKSYSSNKTLKTESKLINSNLFCLSNENILSQENNEAFIQMAKQKIEIQHKINILKIQKEKIEESKRVFENDLKLFNLFNESKQKDYNFEIPELFKKKYDIMIKLNNDNKLNWNEFVKEYHTGENNYEDYFGLNNYESIFIESDNDKSNFSEEIDIESDSSTESSNS
jgi:hypothetical protein